MYSDLFELFLDHKGVSFFDRSFREVYSSLPKSPSHTESEVVGVSLDPLKAKIASGGVSLCGSKVTPILTFGMTGRLGFFHKFRRCNPQNHQTHVVV